MTFDGRPESGEYFLALAVVASSRGTCARRKVGCILVNDRKHVLATGYNGPASGAPHCVEEPCPGAALKSGEGLSTCEAVHAEANALLQCNNVYDIAKAYCTASPCRDCVKLLLNTSCREIVFIEEYPHPEASELWLRGDRIWTKAFKSPIIELAYDLQSLNACVV